MQAPTTPSVPPAQEPDERPCAGCGASNGLSAAFCWRCYRPFGAAGPAPASAASGRTRPGAPNAPAAWAPSTPTSPFPAGPKSSGLGTMAVVAVSTLAVIGAAWFLFFRDGAVTMPQAFGGMPRIDNAQTQLIIDTFHAEMETTGIDGDIVIYGDEIPTAALIWIRDASVPTTEAAFEEFAAGFNQGVGSTGSLGTKQERTVEGVTYVCASVLGATPGTICMWQEDDLFWLVFDFSGGAFEAGQDLSVLAHDAVAAA